MPCNIGYKNFVKATLPEPVPEKFEEEIEAPAIDADLLSKLGNEDQAFVEWVEELETAPLLEEALNRTFNKLRT
jgi:hypothetical protein